MRPSGHAVLAQPAALVAATLAALLAACGGGGSASGPPTLRQLDVVIPSSLGGMAATLRVSLDQPALETLDVSLVGGSAVIAVPPSVRLVPGQTTAEFSVGTSSVTSPVTTTVTATLGAVVKTAAVVVLPPCGGAEVNIAAGESWLPIGPTEWSPACPTVTVRAPDLAPDERLALLLVNAGGPDNATPSLAVSGVPTVAAAPSPVADVLAGPLAAALPPPDLDARAEADALAIARRGAATAAWLAEGAPHLKEVAPRAVMPSAAPAVGDAWPNGGPCAYSYTTNRMDRYPATLRYVSANALFYVTDAAWNAGVANVVAAQPTFFSSLASQYETRILPALTASFGTETDVDGNGKMIFLFADLGRTGSGGFTVGYFDGTDVVRAADTSAHCTGTGSNGADMLYLLDPCTFYKNGFRPPATSCPATGVGTGNYPYSTILNEETPGTMAHELQHNVMFSARCWPITRSSCSGIDDPTRDLWLNEGLSMVSEDFAGYGLHTLSERERMGGYLNCARTNGSLCYQDVSLTQWPTGGAPGDAVGHYGGAHAFLRWLADQADQGRALEASGSALTKALVGSTQLSRPAVAAALGVPFEEAFARFATAALFSGETPMFTAYPASPVPGMSFAPVPDWSPFHADVGRPRYTALPRPGDPTAAFVTSLRADGWGAYVTGLGTGGAATVTVSSSAGVKPRVAVVRFKGSLPNP